MKRPKVGEVWLVRSLYTWGECLVKVTDTSSKWGFKGIVIAAECYDQIPAFTLPRWKDYAEWSFRAVEAVSLVEGR